MKIWGIDEDRLYVIFNFAKSNRFIDIFILGEGR